MNQWFRIEALTALSSLWKENQWNLDTHIMWMLCSVDSFPYNLDIYCGKDSRRTTPLRPYVASTILSPVSRDKQHFFSVIIFFADTSCCVTWLPKIAELVVGYN